MKKIEELRDERWYEEFKKFASKWDNLRPVFAEEFLAGYKASEAYHQKIIAELVTALENAEKALFMFNCDAPLHLTKRPYYLEVRQTLERYKKDL